MTKDKKPAFSRRSLLLGSFLKKDQPWDPKPPVAPAKETAALLARANAAFEAGDFETALTQYRDYVTADMGNMEARRRLGLCFYRLGRFPQAKVEFERVLHQHQKDPFCLLHLGLTLCRLDRAPKACGVWKLYFDPANVTVQREVNLQIALLESGDPVEGQAMAEAVEKAIAQGRPA